MFQFQQVERDKYKDKQEILHRRDGDPRCVWMIHVVTGLVQLVDTFIPHVANLNVTKRENYINGFK